MINKYILSFSFYLILFIVLFFISINISKEKKWKSFDNDTVTYINTSIKNPENDVRTPGMRLYLQMLNVRKPIGILISKYESYYENYNLINKEIEDDIFKHIFFYNFLLTNTFLLCLGLVFLSYTLSIYLYGYCFGIKFISQVWKARFVSALFIILSLIGGSMLPMNYIMPDTVVQIIVPYIVASLLLFIKGNKLVWLFLAGLLSAYAFLVKPSFAFFPLICGIICLWQIVKKLILKKYVLAIKFVAIGIVISICTLIWPLWISFKAGFFVSSQLSAYNISAFAFYLAAPGDENMFHDEKLRDVVKGLFNIQCKIKEEKGNFFPIAGKSKLSSFQQYYHETLNPVIWHKIPTMLSQYGYKHPWENFLEYNRTIGSFAPSIIKKHWKDYLWIASSNFFGAFNQLLPVHYAHAWWISDHYRIAIIFIIIALLSGWKNLRKPILLLAVVHVLHMFFCSMALCIEDRYVSTTEWCMLLAFLLAILSLLINLFRFFIGIFNKQYESLQKSVT